MVKLLRDICLGCIQNNLHRIPQVQRYLPTVYKELLIERLIKHRQLSEHYLCHITYNLFVSSLRHVLLYRCEQNTDLVLKQLAACNCQLHTLQIIRCDNVTDEGILAVTEGQKELKTLELKHLSHITSKGLVNICSLCLEKLSLKGLYISLWGSYNGFFFVGIVKVVSANPLVRVLELKGIPRLDDTIFPSIAQHLGQSLEELDVGLLTMSDVSLEELGRRCPNLKKLNAHGCNRISGQGLISLSQGCTQLKSLDLSYCNKLSARPDSEALWTLPTTLTELSLCGILLEDSDLFVECVTRLKHLMSIRLSGVSALSDDTLTKILEKVGGQLRELDISGSVRQHISDEGLQAVSQCCGKLEVLSLSLLENITGESLLPLFQDTSRTPQLRKLLLSCRKMNVDVLRQVALNCCNLALLDLSGLLCVEDDLLFLLAENSTSLTHVGLKGCRELSDAGICELARCCSLESIILSGVRNVTDKSIFALANSCYNLEEIHLNGCYKVTPAAVRYLEDCCIGYVFVRHIVPNADPSQVMAKNLDTGEFCRVDLQT
ncbi:F-box/LRR-repeat protein 2-like [Liolophura sinensis]|uniref:F-box/LRR-repeat protein 2-like n=1 Tax=Liolophura sinensis TaxID=3198878 RepID=UPI003158895A